MNLLILSSLPSVASVQMLLNQAQGLGLHTRIVSPLDPMPTDLPAPRDCRVISRIGNFAFAQSIQFLQSLEKQGYKIVNSAHNYLQCRQRPLCSQILARAKVAQPLSVTVNEFKAAPFFPVIVKDSFTSLGQGVKVYHLGDEVPDKPEALYQEYIASTAGSDLRLFVVKDQVVAAIHRHNPHDFRANLAISGSTAKAIIPEQKLIDLALAATRALNLIYAGIDIVIDAEGTPLVIEVNASPGLSGIEAATQIPVSKILIEAVLNEENG